jgi:hypothetical protein
MLGDDDHVAQFGVCCGCGYSGVQETPCPAAFDGQHCDHWWDGVTKEQDPKEYAEQQRWNAVQRAKEGGA